MNILFSNNLNTAHLATIQTSTVDNIQGSDSTLIILDLVSTKNLRFMSHEKHSSAVASLSTPLNSGSIDGRYNLNEPQAQALINAAEYHFQSFTGPQLLGRVTFWQP